MKKKTLQFTLLCSLSITFLGLSACQPAAPDTNRNATATATPKETLNPVAIEAEITKLEKDWAAAAQRHDAEAVGKILADDLVMTYPDGTTGTKSSELRDTAAQAMTVESWDLADTKVTVLSADAAFITGRGIIKNGKYKAPEAKTPIDISGEYRFTDIYARRNGQWLAVASQTTRIENPTPAAPPAPVPSRSAAASPSVAASPK